MATRKVKFKLSIKEISFEFEGDQETAQDLAGTINQSLASISDAQNKLLDVEASSVQGRELRSAEIPILPTQTGGKRKRKRKTKSIPIDDSSQNGDSLLSDEESISKGRRTKKDSVSSQLKALLGEGFFVENHSVNEIRTELAKRGHHFESNHISGELLRLTQDGLFARDKNEENKWAYRQA
ncbi:hypothetical protein [Nostoc sp.]|uniref:hypothetical protein n=1 Tax=Nostoc sp. TaxID=1180 RepID=UPI002FFCD774